MRKLASIQKIVDIQPIVGADKIEVATVLGWHCVVAKKDNFKIGDAVVYIEVDSIVPEKPEFEFLRERKFRVKTIRLRGQVSQGLVVPISILPKGKYSEGQDVSEILGVKKYDPEGELEEKLAQQKEKTLQDKVKKYLSRYSWFRTLFPKKPGKFPEFISKTDETRIQAMPQVLNQYANVPMIVTEKVDGQSFTAFLLKKKILFWNKFEFGVCSRNLQLPRPDGSNWWNCAKNYRIESVLKELFNRFDAKDFIAIQGEIVGSGIQGNKYSFYEQHLFVFNLIVDGKNLNTVEIREVVEDYDFVEVPIISSNFNLADYTLDELVEYANGKSILADTLREGVVVRDYDNTISFKVISPEFLLKHNL